MARLISEWKGICLYKNVLQFISAYLATLGRISGVVIEMFEQLLVMGLGAVSLIDVGCSNMVTVDASKLYHIL